MEQKLYVKLFDQRARQTLERTAVEAEMASTQPALNGALAWLSQCETALASAQADLESAQAARQSLAEGEDPTNADALVASSSELVALRQGTTESARGDYLALKGPQDDRQARVDVLTSAIDQCTDLIAGSGMDLTAEERDAVRSAPVVPAKVTMRQARLALLGAGLLSTVTTAIDALAEPQKSAAMVEWEYSSEVHRNKPFVLTLGAALGLSSAQLDALFVQAATL